MDKKIMDCLTNPIKCKLLLEIYASGQVTAKHLAEIYNDIPQATLYRYLKRMTSDGILKVVEENQIRGTVEKTYSLAVDLKAGSTVEIVKYSGEAYMQMFVQYMLGFLKQFQDYCNEPDINIVEDQSGFSLAPIYLTNDELVSVVKKIAEILTPLRENKPAKDRKLRTIGIIVSPPQRM